MINNLIDKLKKHQNKAIQIVLNGLIILISLIICIISHKYIFLIFTAIFLLLINYLISSYTKKNEQLQSQLHEEEFVTILNYVQTYISNNFNVYNAFKETLPMCSNWMQDKISHLLNNMDNDKTINPFITLASNFSSKLIRQTLISLYLMIENGTNADTLLRFTPIFNQLKEDILHNSIKRIESTYDTLNLLPVVGAGIITLTMILGIVGIVQGALYGI